MNSQILLKLTEEKKSEFTAAAEALGVSLSEWLRRAGDAALGIPLVEPKPSGDGILEALREMERRFMTAIESSGYKPMIDLPPNKAKQLADQMGVKTGDQIPQKAQEDPPRKSVAKKVKDLPRHVAPTIPKGKRYTGEKVIKFGKWAYEVEIDGRLQWTYEAPE